MRKCKTINRHAYQIVKYNEILQFRSYYDNQKDSMLKNQQRTNLTIDCKKV